MRVFFLDALEIDGRLEVLLKNIDFIRCGLGYFDEG